jgi:hypothetical protein
MSITVDQCRDAITDLYWLWKWYRDEYPDAEPPAELVKFECVPGLGASDAAGRAFRCIPFDSRPTDPLEEIRALLDRAEELADELTNAEPDHRRASALSRIRDGLDLARERLGAVAPAAEETRP